MDQAQKTNAINNTGWIERHAYAFLIVCFFIAFGYGIWQPGYYHTDELYYMRSAANMVWSSDYLYPVYEQEVRLQKPPAAYWMVAAMYHVFGIHLWSARIAAVLLPLVTILLAGKLGQILFGSRRLNFLVACALISSYGFYRYSRLAMTDALLSFSILLAFYGFALTIFQNRKHGRWVAWIGITLATLTKGPIGFLVPVVSMIVLLIVYRKRSEWKWISVLYPPGITLFVVFVGGWLLLLFSQLDSQNVLGAVEEETGRHFVGLLLHPVSGLFHYAFDIFRGLFPWVLLLAVYRKKHQWDDRVLFLAVWIVVLVLIYSFFVNLIRIRYLLPIMPPLAILAAHALEILEQKQGLKKRLGKAFLWGFVVASGFSTLAAAGVLLPVSIMFDHMELTGASIILAVLSVFVAVRVALYLKKERIRAAIVVGSVGLMFALSIYFNLLMEGGREIGPYWFGKHHLRSIPLEQSVGAVGMNPVERSWLVMGAVHPLSNYAERFDTPEEEFERIRTKPPNHLVVTDTAMEAMPDSLRKEYIQRVSLEYNNFKIKPYMLTERIREGTKVHSGQEIKVLHLFERKIDEH